MGASKGIIAKGLKGAVGAPKKVVSGFWIGFSYAFRGARFVYLQHPTLARYWMLPILITVASCGLVIWASLDTYQGVADWIWAEPEGSGWWGSALVVVHDVFRWLVGLLLWLLGTALVVLVSTTLAAPFNDRLSEAAEAIVTGEQAPPFAWGAFILDLFRTVGIELAKIVLYLLVMVPLFFLSWLVPVLGHVLYSIFGFLFSAAFFALDFSDWPAARRQWSVAKRFGRLRRAPLTMLGFGCGVWLLLMIPVVNLFFLPAAVCGGTLLFLEQEEL